MLVALWVLLGPGPGPVVAVAEPEPMELGVRVPAPVGGEQGPLALGSAGDDPPGLTLRWVEAWPWARQGARPMRLGSALARRLGCAPA